MARYDPDNQPPRSSYCGGICENVIAAVLLAACAGVVVLYWNRIGGEDPDDWVTAFFVAWIDGDDARGTARSRIMYSLRQEIGEKTIEVLPAGLHPHWRNDLGFNAIK